jgi:hypothetical protein
VEACERSDSRPERNETSAAAPEWLGLDTGNDRVLHVAAISGSVLLLWVASRRNPGFTFNRQEVLDVCAWAYNAPFRHNCGDSRYNY